MTPFRPLLFALCVPVVIHVSGCSTDQHALPAGSPDAATVCTPPFCLVVGPDAAPLSGTPTRDGGAGDVATGPGPGDKPKPGDKGTTPTVTVIGVPVVGQTPVTFVGGGTNGASPLAPGCTPASALECPTASGTCKTSATSNPTGTVQGVLCAYGGPFTIASGKPAATVEYLHETAGGQDYYRFRITFDPSFVDNTYGAGAIGWESKGGHTWKDLLGSDHAELELFDNRHVMVMQLKLDYIGIDATKTCGYSSLGVSGGDGKTLIGVPPWVLGSASSLARNLEGCGYCTIPACNGDCRVDSPATDAQWTSNAGAPNWDYRVRYETWISAAAFGASGFGGVNISYVHASPSKESSNTITVIPGPCPPPPGGCPPGTVVFVTETGAVTCVPEVGPPPPNGCEEGEQQVINEDGAIVCEPPGQECPDGQHWVIDKDGKLVCQTTPPDCPEGQLAVVDEDGKLVCETPTETNCPPGTVAYPNSEGGYTCSATPPIP